MHALEVGQDDLAVEGVMVLDAGVGDDLVGNGLLVIAGELISTSRTGLAVGHARSLLFARAPLTAATKALAAIQGDWPPAPG